MNDHAEGDDRTSFSDWFDIHNSNHLAALAHYIQFGSRWPKHFLPADVEFNDRDLEIGTVKNNIMHAWIQLHTEPHTVYRGA